jgi:hypothetical protein
MVSSWLTVPAGCSSACACWCAARSLRAAALWACQTFACRCILHRRQWLATWCLHILISTGLRDKHTKVQHMTWDAWPLRIQHARMQHADACRCYCILSTRALSRSSQPERPNFSYFSGIYRGQSLQIPDVRMKKDGCSRIK